MYFMGIRRPAAQVTQRQAVQSSSSASRLGPLVYHVRLGPQAGSDTADIGQLRGVISGTIDKRRPALQGPRAQCIFVPLVSFYSMKPPLVRGWAGRGLPAPSAGGLALDNDHLDRLGGRADAHILVPILVMQGREGSDVGGG